MRSLRFCSALLNLSTKLIAGLAAACFLLFFSIVTPAQDSPGHFEAGANFTAMRLGTAGSFGPGVEGDFNFGRHIALDGAYSWLPATAFSRHLMTGFFGAKAGTRTEHFGFFGKVRPGFVSFGNVLREETITFGPPPLIISESFRFARLTERALDLGGVVEYYPARRWALRWDMGDAVVFGEPGPKITFIGTPPIVSLFRLPGRTSNNFQFSTGVHYRF